MKAATKRKTGTKVGAPTKKNQALLDAICTGLAVGRSARAMCVEVKISQPTLWRWLGEDEDFRKQYARAREEQADFLADQIVEIADDGSNDTYIKDGVEVTNHDVIARSRLRVDARKWVAAKLKPKKYGDSTTIKGDPEAPQVHRHEGEVKVSAAESYKRMLDES